MIGTPSHGLCLQVPVREYEEDRAHGGQMQLTEIIVTEH
jgi:hypothetical protein